MHRVCPKCNNTVKSPNSLFCYFCGAKLEEQEVNKQFPDSHPDVIEQHINSPKEKLKDENISPRKKYAKYIAFVFFAVLVMSSGFFAYRKFFVSNTSSNKFVSPVEEENEKKFEIDLSSEKLTLSSGELSTKAISQVVPVSVSTFVVLNDPGEFYKNYIEEKSEIDVKELTDLTIDEAASFLESSFGIVFRDDSFAFVAKTKNREFVEKKVSEISTKDITIEDITIYIEVIDEYLVVTNDVNLLNEMQNVNKELSLSLASDAFFVESVKGLPSEGAALVFFRDLNQVKPLVEKLVSIEKFEIKEKSAFVAKKSGDGVILEF